MSEKKMLFIREFQPGDFSAFRPKPESLHEMRGITVIGDDGRTLCCGGVMDAPWGVELWIYITATIDFREEIAIARLAKQYVGQVLASGVERIFAHAFPEDETPDLRRWFAWLGFSRQEEIASESGRRVARYVRE